MTRYSTKVKVPENIVMAPDVEGLQQDAAMSSIEKASLLAVIEGSIESEYITAGKIILQKPVGGAFMEKNTMVIMIDT